MTPQEWNQAYNDNADFAVLVEQRVRIILSAMGEDELTTNGLIEILYPRGVADKSLTGSSARKLIAKTLSNIAARKLADCYRYGEPVQGYYGKMKRPWIWHKPKPLECCAFCGHPLTK